MIKISSIEGDTLQLLLEIVNTKTVDASAQIHQYDLDTLIKLFTAIDYLGNNKLKQLVLQALTSIITSPSFLADNDAMASFLHATSPALIKSLHSSYFFTPLLRYVSAPTATTIPLEHEDEDCNGYCDEDCSKFVCAFSSDGHTLAYAPGNLFSRDDTVQIWDITTGTCIHTLEGHTNRIRCLAFSPNDHLLATGSNNGIVKVWDITTGNCIHTLEGHTSIACLAFSPDGHLLATGSQDDTVKVWDITTGNCMHTLKANINWGRTCLAFSPDGQLLTIGSNDNPVKEVDNTVKRWDLINKKLLQEYMHLPPEQLLLLTLCYHAYIKKININTMHHPTLQEIYQNCPPAIRTQIDIFTTQIAT